MTDSAVTTLLHALNGQTLAPFNYIWRIPHTIFWSK